MNNWPGKPGVPLNPERDGWHWMKRISNGWETLAKWDNDWNGNDDFWWNLPGYSDPEKVAKNFCYLGPVLLPHEAAALQKRVADLEGVQNKLLEILDEACSGLCCCELSTVPSSQIEEQIHAALGGKDE